MDQFQNEISNLRKLSEQFEFPDTYLVIDTETDGFSTKHNHIIEVGWAVVTNHVITDASSLMLNWSALPIAPHARIRNQLAKQAASYHKSGREHHYSWDRLCREGEHPVEVLHAFATIMYEFLARGDMVIGHNAWNFDCNVIERHNKKLLAGYELPWYENSLFDTGLCEKSVQMGIIPSQRDTLVDWWKRTAHVGGNKIKWSLDKYCAGKYDLPSRYDLDMSQSHTAAFDCRVTYALFDTYRQLMEISLGKKESLSQKQDLTQGTTPSRETGPTSRSGSVQAGSTPPIPGIPAYRGS